MNISSHCFVGSYPTYDEFLWSNSYPPVLVSNDSNVASGPNVSVDGNSVYFVVPPTRSSATRMRLYGDDAMLDSILLSIGQSLYVGSSRFQLFTVNGSKTLSDYARFMYGGHVYCLAFTLPESEIPVQLGQLSLGNSLSPDVIEDEEDMI